MFTIKLLPSVKYLKFETKRRFGVELEFGNKVKSSQICKIISDVDKDHHTQFSETYQQDYNNDYWHVKFDRSCGDVEGVGGWEVASYVAKGYKDVDNIGRVTRALCDAGVNVNDNCGVHVHVEVKDFKTQEMAILVSRWIMMENIILEMLPKSRKNNKYCRPLTKKFNLAKNIDVEKFWETVRPKTFGPADRRTALNLCNYSGAGGNRNTIEFRLPEGTSNYHDVKNWVRFFLNFVDCSKGSLYNGVVADDYNLKRMFCDIGLQGRSSFFILSKSLNQLKRWIIDRIRVYATNKQLIDEAHHCADLLALNYSES